MNKKNIIFICHGNICRSVAAEYIAKDMDKEHRFNIISRATSLEEIGNDIYPPMKRELYRQSIPYGYHEAQRIDEVDYDWADVIYYMDDNNLRYLNRLLMDKDHKFKPVFIYSEGIKEIEDPWYTGNFSKVVDQLKRCIKDVFANI
ncbi:MAG: low molecular weight phosphotyrosine protein phosphatase [Bacilli bacterium]|nr:low molecular weight phosphotyrosine protein phosphatase [Bacilli bacterium]